MLDLAPDQPQVALDVGLIGHHPIGERLYHGPRCRQRRAQVVGHRCHEFAAVGFQRAFPLEGLLQLVGHVVEGHRDAGDLIGAPRRHAGS
jgi:hypothetical protein